MAARATVSARSAAADLLNNKHDGGGSLGIVFIPWEMGATGCRGVRERAEYVSMVRLCGEKRVGFVLGRGAGSRGSGERGGMVG